MNEKICPECSTVNEKEFEYCKNCGADLRKLDESTANQGQNNAYETINTNQQYNDFMVENIDGIPMDQIALYVGKKANDYCKKFSKMEITRSKASWSWPSAVLGFLFGPMGAALWCFYRKMYKAAAILVLIGVLFTGVISAATYDANSKMFDTFFSIMESKNATDVIEALENIDEEMVTETTLSTLLEDISCFSSAIIMGLFANYFYKCSVVERIKKYRNSGLDQRYYRLGLSAIGGTSGGMLALGIIIFIAVENIASAIAMSIYFLSK